MRFGGLPDWAHKAVGVANKYGPEVPSLLPIVRIAGQRVWKRVDFLGSMGEHSALFCRASAYRVGALRRRSGLGRGRVPGDAEAERSGHPGAASGGGDALAG